ncbi:Non-structural maintenance of chromosomes element 1-like [Quillaja saponaria]|uniref:Non-structural maintenance of chromosomes element 1 homolog n=1 Tax=Quillaja saponaria TaxID=32244 RepID=A0AAD7LV91_QUISA|nr:Non-structural maintenance of chromosomes element 1-like [Quillaja saponaria]
MTEYSWKHQTIIQALLSRGPLKENEFHSIFKGVTGKTPGTDQKLFKDFLLKINKALSFIHFELRGCRHQYDGQIYYGVVNNVSDEQSKLGTKYSVPQIAFYKAIIEAIVQDATAHGVISNIDALNLRLENQVLTGTESQSEGGLHHVPPTMKNFSISQKEKTLHELVRDQWLIFTADGNVALGVRSFLDLRSWFRSNDVPSCHVCNEAGVKAELCQNEACTARIHQYCLKQLFSQKKGERVCPSCGRQWKYAVPKAEAVQNDDELNGPTESQPPVGSRRLRRRTNNAGDAEIVGTGSSQIPAPTSDLRRITRSSVRRG